MNYQPLALSRLAGLVLAGLVTSPVVYAHHGFGNFAMNEDITISGVITKLDFVNPHSWVHFEVTAADGTKSQHRCELRSATTLRRSGWTPEMFAAGQTITIEGSPDRAEKNACYVSTIKFGDGTVLDRYGQRIPAQVTTQRPARVPSGEPNLFGDWATEQLVMTDPAGRDGTLVPLSRATTFERGAVPVLGGFVGATADGHTTTLGRGGSDYSGALVGAGIGAEEIQIWTDVDGMLTADPRIVNAPRLVPRLSFDEAAELAYFGAKVLHPSTILPAVERDIPVRILNSRKPDGPGTIRMAGRYLGS